MTKPDTLNFSTLIDSLEDGQFRADLEKAVREITTALMVEARLRGGVPTAGLGIALAFKLEGGAIEVRPEMKTKLPKETRRRTILWPTADNMLSKRNPNQQELAFRDVSAPTQFADEADAETA